MENFKEALLSYLTASLENKDLKQLAIALDDMTTAIKKDIVSTIEETIKEAMDTPASGMDLQAKNFQALKAKNHVNSLLNELRLNDNSVMDKFAA